MDALILAAGSGRRLRHARPECLVELGDRLLIDHQLEALAWAGIDRFVVAAGYQADAVHDAVPADTVIVHNPHYGITNSLYSFWLARHEIGEEVLILNA